MKEVMKWASKKDAKLKATDKRFSHKVHVVHEDGSVFVIMDAFLEEKDDYAVVFSEHHGVLVFAKDDLVICQEYEKRVK